MARVLRVRIAGLSQHIVQRGHNRMDIFRCSSDFEFFLAALRRFSTRYLLDVHAYTLMTNHFHVVATPQSSTSICATLHALGPKYVKYFNRKYGRTGTLYEGRYRSCVIDSETYWFRCMRYVEMNPVRAGVVLRPDEYKWSSYSANALGTLDPLIVPHPLYTSLGESPLLQRQSWRGICGEIATEAELTEIRNVSNRGAVLSEDLQRTSHGDERAG
jgi:putative transposase